MARPDTVVLHVTHERDQWCVWCAGQVDEPVRFARKADAVQLGVERARRSAPSRLVIHGVGGEVEVSRRFEPTDEVEARSQYQLGRGAVPRDEV